MSRSRNGMVLLLVLVLILGLAMVVAATTQAQRINLRLVGHFSDQVIARTSAQSGLELAIAAAAGMARGEDERRRDWEATCGDGMCSLRLPNNEGGGLGLRIEDARLNLNAVDAETLSHVPGFEPQVIEKPPVGPAFLEPTPKSYGSDGVAR